MFRKSLTLAVLLAMLAVCRTQTAICREHTGAASRLDAKTMKAALRTAAPEENGFIDRVVSLVDKRKLPRSLVESTFQWARKRPRRKFQYFKWGLTIRARWRGIRL